MALRKSDLRQVLIDFKNDSIQQGDALATILDILHEDVDPLKDEVTRLKTELESKPKNEKAEDSEWKTKFDQISQEYEDYKSEQAKKETRQTKRNAFKSILEDAKLDETGRKLAEKYINLEAYELDESGSFKNKQELLDTVTSDFSAYVVKTEQSGSKDKEGSGSGSGSGMTKKEILAIKDTTERQKAIAENHELFGF